MTDIYQSNREKQTPPKRPGQIILELDHNGQLRLFPIADSDEEVRHLLSVIRESIINGELSELIA
jgi:hypothetical protein